MLLVRITLHIIAELRRDVNKPIDISPIVAYHRSIGKQHGKESESHEVH
jgi:hypothetical protein